MMRHPAYGTYIAITWRLAGRGCPRMYAPVTFRQGRFVTRSAYAIFVHYADDGSWFFSRSMFDLNIPKL